MTAGRDGPRVVRVLPDVAALGRPFDYEVPAGWEGAVAVGSRVRIPLNGRRVGGWVLEDDAAPEPGVSVKRLAKLSGLGPPAPVLALAQWAAWRWAGPLSALLTMASPERVVSALPPAPPRAVLGRSPDDPLGRAATRALRADDRPALLQVPPATDLLAVVLAAVATGPGPVLVLAPSVGWAERLRDRLVRRGIPATSQWAEAAAGWPVVVGSRGAAFAPLPRIGAAVVLDAHDQAYREERAPQFAAPAVVAERARRDGAPCLFTSPTPTVTLLEGSRHSTMPADAERAGWAALSVIDRRGADPRTGLYSEELVRLLRAAPGRAVAVLNRRGRAKLLACAHCGAIATCERCGRSVAEHEGRLLCPACGAGRPRVCASCGGVRMKVLRPGVSRVRDELGALLGAEVAEVSGPADGPVPDAPVLVGTEAVLHRVRRASVVAFLDVDLHLLAPRLGAGEESLALLARASRLVGGRGTPGSGVVAVQTRLPDHGVLRAAVAGHVGPFLAAEAALRRELSLPPFRALAELSGPGAAEFATAVGLEAADLGDGRFLLSAPDHATLCDRLAETARPRERVRVLVDPPGV